MIASRAPRLRVGVIGVGRVGSVLAAALGTAGHQVVAATAVSVQSRRRAATLLPGVALLPADEVIAASDLVLLTVSDDQLPGLIAGLASTGAWRAGQLAVHTSGATGIAVFDPAVAAGVVGMALHPIMTFTGRSEDLLRLPGAAYGVTAPPDFRPVAETLVLQLGGEPVWVPEEARPGYHAALSMGSNHLITLVNDAAQALSILGVDNPRRLLTPLLTASLDNALLLGDDALTGPVSRGDHMTVSAHLAALAGTPFVSAYRAMALRTVQRAHLAGRLSDTQRDGLLLVLGSARDADEGRDTDTGRDTEPGRDAGGGTSGEGAS